MVVMASSISTPCELLSGTNAAGSGSASAAIERAIILVLPLYTACPGGEQHRNGARNLQSNSRKKDQDSVCVQNSC